MNIINGKKRKKAAIDRWTRLSERDKFKRKQIWGQASNQTHTHTTLAYLWYSFRLKYFIYSVARRSMHLSHFCLDTKSCALSTRRMRRRVFVLLCFFFSFFFCFLWVICAFSWIHIFIHCMCALVPMHNSAIYSVQLHIIIICVHNICERGAFSLKKKNRLCCVIGQWFVADEIGNGTYKTLYSLIKCINSLSDEIHFSSSASCDFCTIMHPELCDAHNFWQNTASKSNFNHWQWCITYSPFSKQTWTFARANISNNISFIVRAIIVFAWTRHDFVAKTCKQIN